MNKWRSRCYDLQKDGLFQRLQHPFSVLEMLSHPRIRPPPLLHLVGHTRRAKPLLRSTERLSLSTATTSFLVSRNAVASAHPAPAAPPSSRAYAKGEARYDLQKDCLFQRLQHLFSFLEMLSHPRIRPPPLLHPVGHTRRAKPATYLRKYDHQLPLRPPRIRLQKLRPAAVALHSRQRATQCVVVTHRYAERVGRI